MTVYIKGIDVSHWEPQIDWHKLRAQGIHFAFIKASQADFADSCFESHWAGAKAAGILRGAYHFLDPRVDGAVQARRFLNTVKLEPGDLPPVLDLEELHFAAPQPASGERGGRNMGHGGKKQGRRRDVQEHDDTTSIPGPELVARAEQWLKVVEDATGRVPIIYSGPSYLEHRFLGRNNATPHWASKYVLWVANYLDVMTENSLPLQPKGWPDWKFWQYSEHEFIDGVMGDGQPTQVDVNYFRGTLEDLYALAGAVMRDVLKDGVVTKEEAHRVAEVLDDIAHAEAAQPAESPIKPPAEAPVESQPHFIKHLVRSGDTLFGIALKYHTTKEEIMKFNPQIKDPNIIFDGDTLNIPQ